ncbi:aminotransferase class I/II-fold pyridoxal phosphate-dependent enzyme [Novosphingobium sp. ERN07]|uniref:trans-sulfuration enzyme family protein n=1 Tax=Novosphingobium sp. ERN07 TaxID=2726187 RepID=UPI001456477C|nr:aminotransferase class I/II-fold pyridoxal phosphate-dependent enzyme [Novosphingobium sp. ERN07]NLR70306.1 aminotransferase class I/II-fold pyridoxal phosphate-dependent enzyme [Novosphingobium sp. ERN07]
MKDLTQLVHRPQVDQTGFSSLSVPTHRASTIVFPSADAYTRRQAREPDGYAYGLGGTPTTRVLEAQIAALEQGERTILLPSGQAAIALLFLTVLKPGDTVLIPDTAYPPVRALCADVLAAQGIMHRIYPPLTGAGIEAFIDDSVRLIWTESPGSATMEVEDLPAIVTVARRRGILTGCDNTWATPLLFKPLAAGMDFSVEALTKYAAGHSDVLLGSVTLCERTWYVRLRAMAKVLGIGVSPDDCALVLRGIETLGVRINHIGKVSTAIAEALRTHPAVAQVLHPALPECPGHAFWKRDMTGASGVFSVALRPELDTRLDDSLAAMQVFVIGASWGGTRSLVAPMTVRGRLGGYPAGRLLRISIGLEDKDDLLCDLLDLLDRLVAS